MEGVAGKGSSRARLESLATASIAVVAAGEAPVMGEMCRDSEQQPNPELRLTSHPEGRGVRAGEQQTRAADRRYPERSSDPASVVSGEALKLEQIEG